MRIIIRVTKGGVHTVMSTSEDVEVEVFDEDSMSEDPELLTKDGESPDLDELWKEKTKGMREVW